MEAQDRNEIIARSVLTCPVDRYRLEPDTRYSTSLTHRLKCPVCGCVVSLPRVALAKALKRRGKR